MHLGGAGDRTRLVQFLGLDDPAALEALDRCLASLDAYRLLHPEGGLAVELRHLWRPYGLGPRPTDVLPEWTVDGLRAALQALGEPTGGRKADLVARLAAVLADERRLGEALATAPGDDRRALEAAAVGDGVVDLGYVSWDGRVRGRTSWTLSRGLATRTWDGRVVLPAEVTLAMRGSGWRPPFQWRFPPIAWTETHRDLVDREAAAAATRTLRLLTALLGELTARPARLNRDGTLGVRERKRLATTLADRLRVLLRTWLGMVQVPLAAPDRPWHPMSDPSWGRRRLIPPEVLAMAPGQALADEDPDAVLRVWAGAARETARLQADLTAVVLGDPSDRLGRVLDLMADRESRGQATTWRFSAASVARALDEGQTAEGLLAALAAVADDAVPQPLYYLVRDTARRHGVLRAGAVNPGPPPRHVQLRDELLCGCRRVMVGLNRAAGRRGGLMRTSAPLTTPCRSPTKPRAPDSASERSEETDGEPTYIGDVIHLRGRDGALTSGQLQRSLLGATESLRQGGAPVHLRVVVPITASTVASNVKADVGRWTSPGTTIDVVQIAAGPESIESEYDEALALPGILELVQQAARDDVDGIFVSCFAEPAVHAAREIIDVPVFGGFEPAVHAAMGMADRVGILSILPDVVPGLRRRISAYGLSDRVPDIRVVDVPVLGVDDHAVVLGRLEAEARAALGAGAAEAFVLGCTGMLGLADQLMDRLAETHGHIPVVDPTGAAIIALESAVRLGIRPSRLAYFPPRAKERTPAPASVA